MSQLNTPLLVRIIRWGFCLAILAAIIGGLFVAGSPAARRREALDTQRVNSLSSLTYAIDTYYQTNGTLPADLDTLRAQQSYLSTDLRDPITGQLYEYRPLSTTNSSSTVQYELCATFDSILTDSALNARSQPVPFPTNDTLLWSHGIGRTCYSFSVRPATLKPIETRLPPPPVTNL